ncbi:uncharacterized protein BO72DRAFT_444039 [Aspergillus fijiensis CBS 313.89]|uniref:Uncharacterized protein n=1 Tax=Aspergillus fijiensis CBS 313.89 TaxID=1448319 RepID=A0A8G1S059_9EURO|nr:uncharacterized protein BO72DRAFT_444039 [Aspergillus fijiensis CBS 313.89]RAK82064.1 hypothetical protein BO72DRAFT_444039 [Aspergillus fijiensis CBS 313.89]
MVRLSQTRQSVLLPTWPVAEPGLEHHIYLCRGLARHFYPILAVVFFVSALTRYYRPSRPCRPVEIDTLPAEVTAAKTLNIQPEFNIMPGVRTGDYMLYEY